MSAREVADLAGRVLLELRAELQRSGADSRAARDAGDAASQRVLMDAIASAHPDDAILSEEGKDDRRRLTADRVWIIDPLDGTREFSEVERDDWAVHVALLERGVFTDAAVALPARGITYSTDAPPGRPKRADGPLRLAVSRSRPPAFVTELAERLGADLVPMGSAGVKAMAVVDGTVDAYLHAGGQYEWDSAAPVAVAAAAGLHTSRIDGTPLEYNRPDPWLPDLLVCVPAQAAQLLRAIEAQGALDA